MCTGSTLELKFGDDSNDISEDPHDDKPRPYLCTVCDKRFTRKCHLVNHRNLHTGEKLYSCTQCEKRFSTKRYLRTHMFIHSTVYKCNECEKCFDSNQPLTVHKRSHSGEKLFECSDCGR